MGDGRDVGRKYVGGIGCGSGCRLESRGAVVGEAGMCRVVFLFLYVVCSLNTSQSQLLNSPITQHLYLPTCHRLQVPV